MHTRDLPFIYITGGCRSGKSAYAQRLAEELSSGCLYLATAIPQDDAMRERIRLHREARGEVWRTYEAPASDNDALLAALQRLCRPGETLLFDCLTLWAAGHMRGEQAPSDFGARCDELLQGLWQLPCPVIIVSNEVGMGVVPVSAAGRNFRDMAGLAGQKAAAAATFAVFMVSGLPLVLKGTVPKICSDPEYCI
ncbi:MAG: bifunctional adenosylcobinamide kinase/adenosylcobinamide-phosphate guanylyltransferase [Desulfovibrionaceae bacterium]|nr:bifunctional adenosylcobinamide kinase/adenosylcobinamide-phosphate guanylyltransferase [Desulfovibrionaceae bacterium]